MPRTPPRPLCHFPVNMVIPSAFLSFLLTFPACCRTPANTCGPRSSRARGGHRERWRRSGAKAEVAVGRSGRRVAGPQPAMLKLPCKVWQGDGGAASGCCCVNRAWHAGTGCSADHPWAGHLGCHRSHHAPLPWLPGRCCAERWPPTLPGWGSSLAFASCPAKVADSETGRGIVIQGWSWRSNLAPS